MVGIAEAAQLVTFLRSAGDITKAMLDLKIAEDERDKVISLQRIIMDAQGSALQAQLDFREAIEKTRELEENIRAFNKWEETASRYTLHKWPQGTMTYLLDDDEKEGHSICPQCYEDRIKSIMQPRFDMGQTKLKCHRCSMAVTIETSPLPTSLGPNYHAR